jgi:mitochondrial import receptor subunit TOM40
VGILKIDCASDANYLESLIGTLLTNFFFDGARADLTKALSISPIFQVTHAFSMGATSERGPLPSSYNFGAVYGSDRVSTINLQ